jgi:hypothetical protein
VAEPIEAAERRFDMILPKGITIPAAVPNKGLPRTRHTFRRTWGRVRWRMVAIIAFMGASTILVGCLGIAALNVVVRRESANVVEKQIQLLVQASRSVAPAILDHAGACEDRPTDSGELKALLTYTDQAFPQAQTFLMVQGAGGMSSLLLGPAPLSVNSASAALIQSLEKHPDWLPASGFSGLVAYRGQIEIRNVVVKQNAACKVTVIFSLPLGSELAKRLSSAAGLEVTVVSPQPWSPSQEILRTMERNFLPGISKSAAVVLTARNWETGVEEDWIAYSVRDSYSSTFEDVVRFGRRLADWVWLLAALSLAVLLMGASGVWMSIRFGNDLATAIDDLSSAPDRAWQLRLEDARTQHGPTG